MMIPTSIFHIDATKSRRAMFFFLDAAASEDEEVQHDGVVSVICTGSSKEIATTGRHDIPAANQEQLFELGRFIAFAAPLKVAAVHFAYFPQSRFYSGVAQSVTAIARIIQGRVTFFPHEISTCFSCDSFLLLSAIC